MVRCSCIGKDCDRRLGFRSGPEGKERCMAAADEPAAAYVEWLVWARVNSN